MLEHEREETTGEKPPLAPVQAASSQSASPAAAGSATAPPSAAEHKESGPKLEGYETLRGRIAELEKAEKLLTSSLKRAQHLLQPRTGSPSPVPLTPPSILSGGKKAPAFDLNRVLSATGTTSPSPADPEPREPSVRRKILFPEDDESANESAKVPALPTSPVGPGSSTGLKGLKEKRTFFGGDQVSSVMIAVAAFLVLTVLVQSYMLLAGD